MPPLEGGLYCYVLVTLLLGGGCDSSLFIFKFSFIENKVGEIFNDILVYIFHEDFYAKFWDFKNMQNEPNNTHIPNMQL